MPKTVEKVLAYMTRKTPGRREVLVFEHQNIPNAGIQVPAGTVEPGESLEKAILREVEEESGLVFEGKCRRLGRFPWFREDRNELHNRNVFHLEFSGDLKDEWLHSVQGQGEDSQMVFRHYWMDVEEAKNKLAADQENYLSLM